MASDKEKRDYNSELLKLFEKATNEQRHLSAEDSFRKVTGKKRDVMIHIAVTIMPEVNEKRVIGEKENEICQFAVRVPAPKWPIKRSWCKTMMQELTLHAYRRMMAAGLVRE